MEAIHSEWTVASPYCQCLEPGSPHNIMRLQVCSLQQVPCSVCIQLCKQPAVARPHIMLLALPRPRRATLISADKVTKAVASPRWEHNLMMAPCQVPHVPHIVHRSAKMENVFMSPVCRDWPSPLHTALTGR